MSCFSSVQAFGNDISASPSDYAGYAQTAVGQSVPAQTAIKSAYQLAMQAHISLSNILSKGPQGFNNMLASMAVNLLARLYAVNSELSSRTDTDKLALMPEFPKYIDYLKKIADIKPEILKLDPSLGQAILDRSRLAQEALASGDLDNPLIPDEVKQRALEDAKSGALADYMGQFAQDQVEIKYVSTGKDPVKSGMNIGTGAVIAIVAGLAALYFTLK